MKTIVRVMLLTTVTVAFLGISLISSASEPTNEVSARGFDRNDNKKRRRGRGDDDGNQNSNGNRNSNSNSQRVNVSSDAARQTALKRVAGQIIKEELENEDGRTVYEFYIRKSNGDVFEVYVDANSGEVVKVELRD